MTTITEPHVSARGAGMTKDEKFVIFASSLGTIFEWYDFFIYGTLAANPRVFEKSLFLIVYDEHGGFYDHVAPPAAVVPDDTSGHAQFGFDRLGVRVPAILVSPWVGEGIADHTVYDHTSLPATLKTMFGLPRFLTARDAAAATTTY